MRGYGRLPGDPLPTFALLLVLLVAQGCVLLGFGAAAGAGVGAYVARDIRVKVGAAIKVQFEPQKDATFIGRSGRDTSYLAGTSQLFGRVRDLRGDTVWVVVSEAATSTGHRVRYDRQRAPLVAIVPGPEVRVEPLGSQLASIVTGSFFGMGAAIVYVFGYCMLNPCFD